MLTISIYTDHTSTSYNDKKHHQDKTSNSFHWFNIETFTMKFSLETYYTPSSKGTEPCHLHAGDSSTLASQKLRSSTSRCAPSRLTDCMDMMLPNRLKVFKHSNRVLGTSANKSHLLHTTCCTWKGAQCVECDLHKIAPRPPQRACWRQFEVQWGDCKISIWAFQCYYYYCYYYLLARRLGLQFWSSSPGVFSRYSRFLPSFISLMIQPTK